MHRFIQTAIHQTLHAHTSHIPSVASAVTGSHQRVLLGVVGLVTHVAHEPLARRDAAETCVVWYVVEMSVNV